MLLPAAIAASFLVPSTAAAPGYGIHVQAGNANPKLAITGWGTPPEAPEQPPGCAKSYTASQFHKAARKSFKAVPYRNHERTTLKRVLRCQKHARMKPRLRRHLHRYKAAFTRRFYWQIARSRLPWGMLATLARIASCESGGDPRAISPGGTYRGKYQFDYQTWGSVGGRGDPAAASEAEQDVRAAMLYRSRGSQPWPVCG